MESALQFRELHFNTVRILYFVDKDHCSWFRSTDIGKILQIQELDQVMRNYVPEKYTTIYENIFFINEYGLFAVIMKSKCFITAEQFGVWMFQDILPSIRKQEEYRRTQKEVQRFEAEIARVNAFVAELESLNQQLRLEIQDLNRQREAHQILMNNIKQQRVVPTEDPGRRNCLIIFKKNEDVPFPYFAMRVQECNIYPRIREELPKYPRMEGIFYTSCPNSINLFNRLKEKRLFNFRNDSEDCYNSFNVAATEEELISYIQNVHNERFE